MSERRPAVAIEPARREEMAAAFRLLFQHLDEESRETRVANALKMLREKELNPGGMLVARAQGELQGALFFQPVAGASGLIWPPQTQPARIAEVEDQLVNNACRLLAERDAKLVQSLLSSEESSLGTSLERNGFRHITQLRYLRHDLQFSAQFFQHSDTLSFQSYASCAAEQFHQTLLRTYEATRDCPEVNGVREIEEIIAGHKSQGKHNPECWWLASKRSRPVGVLLLAEMPDLKSWDLLYLGLVPEARGKGLGHELVRKALWEARAAEAPQLTLSVDARNEPALNLYKSAGFEVYDQREVLLRILR
jgi:ribosomal protein S18 acetylase RimI-like enzyme